MIIFDPSKKAIFSPHNLNLVGSPQKAIMVFDDEVWEDYIEKNVGLDVLPVRNVKGRIFSNLYLYKKNDENILLISPGAGGSASSIDLELLIASGINKIVAFGTCGAMDKNIAKNTIIGPSSAYREEGVSYHYLPPADEISQEKKSIEKMENIFSQHSIEFLVGKVWTTDAVYRETLGKLKIMKDKGCIAVDMELSSLLAVSEFRHIDFAGFLVTDDNIDGKCSEEKERNSAKLLQIAIEIVNNI